ncbi:MAG TPA: hypothetical protein VEK11_11855 [Thermoanaerobaculia bacterium]|nr:hypothetical protein [Thermoanaerobaculia bacterium]
MRKIVLGLLLVTTVASAEDSPLVAAAKRTNRKAPKSRVITNDTLARSGGGRMAVASGEAKPLPVVPPSTTPAPAPQSTSRPSPTTVPAPAPAMGDGTPYTSARNIDPQASARTIAPTSSITVAPPPSSAGRIDPSSSGRNIDPSSSARNIEPQAVKPPSGN